MLSKISRFVFAGVGLLSAAPLLWSAPAQAAFASCQSSLNQTSGYVVVNDPARTYSVECNQGATDVVAQGRSNSSQSQIQVRLRFASNAPNPTAFAFGYDLSQRQVCTARDSTSGTSFVTANCSGPVTYLSLVVINDE